MDDDDFDAMDAEEMAIFADDMADLRAAEKRIAELEGEKDVWIERAQSLEKMIVDAHMKAFGPPRNYAYSDPQGTVDLLVADIGATQHERDSLLASNVALLEAHDQIGIGGNHLASALIHILGAGNDTFPPYQTDYSAAQEIIGDPIKFDLWWCWAVIMRQRDALSNTATTDALERVREEVSEKLKITYGAEIIELCELVDRLLGLDGVEDGVSVEEHWKAGIERVRKEAKAEVLDSLKKQAEDLRTISGKGSLRARLLALVVDELLAKAAELRGGQ